MWWLLLMNDKKAYWCYECNCSLTLEEFMSKEHADEHEGKWLNDDPMMESEILQQRKESPLQMNTLENIKKDPSRKQGNKK